MSLVCPYGLIRNTESNHSFIYWQAGVPPSRWPRENARRTCPCPWSQPAHAMGIQQTCQHVTTCRYVIIAFDKCSARVTVHSAPVITEKRQHKLLLSKKVVLLSGDKGTHWPPVAVQTDRRPSGGQGSGPRCWLEHLQAGDRRALNRLPAKLDSYLNKTFLIMFGNYPR